MAIPESIEAFLMRLGFDYSTVDAGSDGALVPGTGSSELVETIVLVADNTPVLTAIPAGDRVDLERVRQLAGAHRIRQATGDEIAALYPGSDAGAVPPLGPLFGQQVLVDETLTHAEHLVFPAGTTRDGIRMRYRDFAALVHPTVGRVTRPA